MKVKELIANYFHKRITDTESEVSRRQTLLRFRDIQVPDTYELQYALIKLEILQEVYRDISVFMRIEDNIITNAPTTKNTTDVHD